MMGIIESDYTFDNSTPAFGYSTQPSQPLTKNTVNNFSTIQSSDENSDTEHSSNSDATEITKEFFENYPVLEIPWDDPSLYVEEEENAAINENLIPSAPIKPAQVVSRWDSLKPEYSKNLKKVIRKKEKVQKPRNTLKSQTSEESFTLEKIDYFSMPDFDVDRNSVTSIYCQLEENYQRQNYIHQKILELQEEAYQLEYEAHFLQSTLYQCN